MADVTAEGPVGSARIAQDLDALDARVWAQLLRALRRNGSLPSTFASLLALPTSELVAGANRRELSRSLSVEPSVLQALLEDPALPAAAHRVLEASSGVDAADGSGPEEGASAADAADARVAARQRELRRELVEVRRQRDGAEARAGIAEARVAEAEDVRVQLEHRIAELEVELGRIREEVTQAVARAERRSSSRIEELERTLAAERSTLDALRRGSDRERVVLENLRSELDELRARSTSGVATQAHVTRPLVLPDALEPDTTEAARWLLDGADTLLVDGYNVSLALHAGHPLAEQRRWLLDRLRPLVARGRTEPVVVFDGDGDGSTQRDPSGVEVRFTAAGTIADDEIVFAVAATDGPVLVITDDVQLQERVRAEGGNVLGTIHLLGAIDA